MYYRFRRTSVSKNSAILNEVFFYSNSIMITYVVMCTQYTKLFHKTLQRKRIGILLYPKWLYITRISSLLQSYENKNHNFPLQCYFLWDPYIFPNDECYQTRVFKQWWAVGLRSDPWRLVFWRGSGSCKKLRGKLF